jgi:2',3'-cyclic-nucleotide 2'-phosphodiesterase
MDLNASDLNANFPSPAETPLVRCVLVGDTVGKPGLTIVCQAVPWLRKHLSAALIIVNAENCADGTGLRNREYRKLVEAGVDAITLGDHIYRKREIIETLRSANNIVKPANFPEAAPGKSWCVVPTSTGIPVAVMSALGRVFMRPVDCPFVAITKVLSELPAEVKIRVLDLHAEATSDKQTIARYFDGQLTACLGTHTHVTTADEQILPKGTGFQCDIGMTGPYESILGRGIDPVTTTNLTFEPTMFDVATGDVRLAATWFDADPTTGKCHRIGRLQWTQELIQSWQPINRDSRSRS